MNMFYKLLPILLLPIYMAYAMESEKNKGTRSVEEGLPLGMIAMGKLLAQESKEATQTTRQRSDTENEPNPNPARLSARTNTQTSSTHSSTPTASVPSLPQSVSASTVNLYREGNVSAPDLMKSTFEKTGYENPAGEEAEEIERTIRKLILRIPTFINTSSTSKIISRSADEKVGDEKLVKTKSGSMSVSKSLPNTFEDTLAEILHQIIKLMNLKVNSSHHILIHGKDGENGKNSLASIHRYLEIEAKEQKGAIFRPGEGQNTLKQLLNDVLRDQLKANAIERPNMQVLPGEKKNIFGNNCWMYTIMGINLAVGLTTLAVSAATFGMK